MKLLITGGHVTPALAVIDEIQKEYKDVQILFVGRKYPVDRDTAISMEFQEVQRKIIPFIHLEAGRFTRLVNFRSLRHILKIPHGFINAWNIISKEKPDAVLTFGSYIALPIAVSAFVQHIPVYTQEQTIHPGLSNKIIGHIAKKIFVSFEESARFFNGKKTIVSGNPVRSCILSANFSSLSIAKGRPVLYISGGSLGSHSINVHILTILPKLLKRFTVIHQTGDSAEYKDYDECLKVKNALSTNIQSFYIIKKHFLEDEIGAVYNASNLFIGRAGANTFFELIALKKPALFIPLPWSAHKEQQKQAEFFKKHNIGAVFNQSSPSEELYKQILFMIEHLEDFKQSFRRLPSLYKHNAAEIILKEIIH